MNNMNGNQEALLRKIQGLSFCKVETELYLDTHPECKRALEYYREILKELDNSMTEYHNSYGPLFAEGVIGDKWTWVEGKWPWQLNDMTMEGK